MELNMFKGLIFRGMVFLLFLPFILSILEDMFTRRRTEPRSYFNMATAMGAIFAGIIAFSGCIFFCKFFSLGIDGLITSTMVCLIAEICVVLFLLSKKDYCMFKHWYTLVTPHKINKGKTEYFKDVIEEVIRWVPLKKQKSVYSKFVNYYYTQSFKRVARKEIGGMQGNSLKKITKRKIKEVSKAWNKY